MLLTLVLECELCGANPWQYFANVLAAIAADWPANRLDELLPRQWLAAQQPEQEVASQAADASVIDADDAC